MKRKFRLIPLGLALLLLSLSFSSTLAASSDSLVPDMSSFTKTVLDGKDVTFTRDDFLSRVSIGNFLQGIVIASLPDPDLGELRCGTRALLPGEAVMADEFDSIKFVPALKGTASAAFSFLPVFDTGTSVDKVTVDLKILARENRAPVAENMELKTYKNIAITQHFPAKDPDEDVLVYKLTSKPKRGEVEVLDGGTFIYTPYQNKTGNDSFTYVATDPYGNVSTEAKVKITIEKAQTKTAYADMNNHPAHYAAIRLAESGIFVGKQVGSQCFFEPDAPVSRGEFVAMVVALTGEESVTPVSKTGFADDEAIPVWVKPYAVSALRSGIIRGVTDSTGRIELRATQSISPAESAVMLNNALGMPDAYVPVFAYEAAAPAWAMQACVNMDALGIMEAELSTETESLTRAQAAEILMNALEYKEQNEPKKGLLSWVFG